MTKQITGNDNSGAIHAGHRERLKGYFIENGGNGLSPHNILEMLLFFSIPRCDTNAMAHRLINEFGSLGEVFNADCDSLCRVQGVGKRTAMLIMVVGALIHELNREACTQNIKTIETAEDAAIYLKPKFVDASEEIVALLCIDNRGSVKKCSVLSSGGIDYVKADIRTIVAEILNSKATGIFLAHNHPHGFPVPSDNDICVTKELSSILSAFSVRLIDHIIFSNDDYMLMSANRNAAPYINIKPLMRETQQNLFSDNKY